MLDHFGMWENPFKDNLDPRYFYTSSQHRTCLAKTLYCITERQPMALITGPIGVGKSMAISRLVDMLGERGDAFQAVRVTNPAETTTGLGLLRTLCGELGIPMRRSKEKQMRQLQEELVARYAAGTHVVVLIDEAQMLNATARGGQLELIRELTNFEAGEKLVTIVLAGQPELRDVLAAHPAIEDRISTSSALEVFDLAEATALVNHRCAVVGRHEPLLTPEAMKLAYDASRGLPRKLLNLCFNALPLAWEADQTVIDAGVLAKVVDSVLSVRPRAVEITVSRAPEVIHA